MNHELVIVLVLLGIAIAFFVTGKPRMDVVAILVVVALPLSGVLTLGEALSGFSDPTVILVASMFVIGGGLVRTGVVYRITTWLGHKAGDSEPRLLVLLMLITAALGSVINSTGIVAVFIPVVLSLARRMNSSPGRFLMPLSFAGLISGMLTLVGTPPNMVLQSELIRKGYDGFSFFSFTPISLVILGVGIVYMLVVRRWLNTSEAKPEAGSERRNVQDLIDDYVLGDRAQRVRILPDSPLIGQSLGEVRLRSQYGINVVGIERKRGLTSEMIPPDATTELHAADILLFDIFEKCDDLETLCESLSLERLNFSDMSQHIGMAEVMITPGSQLIGKTVVQATFRTRYGLNVIGLRRKRQAQEAPRKAKLRPGDTLLVIGPWKTIHHLQGYAGNFLFLSLPAEIDDVAPALSQAPYALLSLAITVVLMVSGIVPIVLAALIGCLLMGLFRCVDLASLYRIIPWPVLILVAGMLPIALALQKTGGISLMVDGLIAVVGEAGPRVILTTLFVLTAVIGMFISNTATAVLMAPVALTTAQQLGASPYPFAMTVALAASAAFMTPISSPVVTLVVAPGQYRFVDFVRIGVPFTLIVMAISIFLIPLLFPFYKTFA